MVRHDVELKASELRAKRLGIDSDMYVLAENALDAIEEKIRAIAKRIYHAKHLLMLPAAKKKAASVIPSPS